jgi:hypothetical protein
MAQAKRMDVLLPMIVSGLVDRADFALARIWLSDMRAAVADNEERFLRLSASAGSSRIDGRPWNKTEGEFARIQMGVLKIGHIDGLGERHLSSSEEKHAVEDPLEIQIGQERNGLRTTRSVP